VSLNSLTQHPLSFRGPAIHRLGTASLSFIRTVMKWGSLSCQRVWQSSEGEKCTGSYIGENCGLGCVCERTGQGQLVSATAVAVVNSLQPKRRPLYLKPQSVPRCKHFSSRL
jgi:hypothetical protein